MLNNESNLHRKGIVEIDNELNIYHWLDYNEENIYEDFLIKRNDDFSYCIRDSKANDLRIKKIFHLNPDTIYYVTADIRTENVVNHENQKNPIAACISTNDWFCSKSLSGSNEWMSVGVLGRTDEFGNLLVSMNLGYSFNACSGCAWFENFRFIPFDKIVDEDNKWRFLAVILVNTEATIVSDEMKTSSHLSHHMSNDERAVIRQSLEQFEEAFNHDAEGLLSVEVDILESKKTFNDFTKSNYGYEASGPSANQYLEEIGIDPLAYDHIFFIACQPGLPATYYGLGGLPIQGHVGYSFILHLSVENCLYYLNQEASGSWPPAIYLHEFLHSIESTSNALRLPVPLVDGERLGYPDREEYRLWYYDFIHQNIEIAGKKTGVDPRVWRLRPSIFK